MKRIFIIDDNKLLLSYLGKQLTKAGCDVTTTLSGLQALKMLAEQTPDVVFIDYFLPSLNGDKLCPVIRKMDHLKGAYLVVMSAAASELQLDLSSIGANAIIAKGSFKETVKYMLSAIADAGDDSETVRATTPTHEAMGFDSVHPRQITNELPGKYRHLQTMLDSISEGILEINDGRIVYMNPTALDLLDTSEEQLLATYFPDLFDEPALGQIEALIRSDAGQPVAPGKNPSIQYHEKILSIKKLPFQDDDETIILLITDVTEHMHLEAERTRAEGILRESEEMARALLNATAEAVALIDASGVVFDVNEEGAHRYGRTRAEMINAVIWDFLPEKLAEHRKGKAAEVLQTIEAVRFEDECEGTWNDNVIYPILDTDGNVMRLAVFSRDITEHKKTQEQLLRSERLVATGQLAVSIAHEINSP
ncbi:MAG: PAS domain S-box protein, partial [Desulfobacterales bacterium]